jgi:hypothetical protein
MKNEKWKIKKIENGKCPMIDGKRPLERPRALGPIPRRLHGINPFPFFILHFPFSIYHSSSDRNRTERPREREGP